jgi:hypothetical protein
MTKNSTMTPKQIDQLGVLHLKPYEKDSEVVQQFDKLHAIIMKAMEDFLLDTNINPDVPLNVLISNIITLTNAISCDCQISRSSILFRIAMVLLAEGGINIREETKEELEGLIH